MVDSGAGDVLTTNVDDQRSKAQGIVTEVAPQVTRKGPSDKARKALLDTIVVTVLLVLLGIVLAGADLVQIDVGVQTILLAVATGGLIGASFLFNTIAWDKLAASGPSILNRARADVYLTIVSIAALVTVILMVVVEVLALLVFLEYIPSDDVGAAGSAFAGNFVLVQTVMLLVYLFALVVRENNPSRYQPSKGATRAALVLTPLAGLCIIAGVLVATNVVNPLELKTSQAVYIVTLGVLFEFMAMRIRLRLPSLWSLFRGAVNQAKRPDEEMAELLKKRALRTYIIASVFVAASMGFAGAMAVGVVPGLEDANVAGSLIVFYVGAGVILLGIVAVRMLQHRKLHRPAADTGSDLDRLVSQRRRSPQEVFRFAVYAVTGFFALIAAVLCYMTAQGNFGDNKEGFGPKYATDLFIVAAMFGAGPVGFFFNREKNRIAAIDEKFPDFLRDIAESARAGMTLPRALVTASQGTYGALTPEIKIMAAQVEWGVDFGDALQRFAKRTHTPLINRTVALIVEAQKAGGSMVDILTAASEDAREIKQIVAERASQMGMYNVVIYISFFVFIAVVAVLAAQFIPAFKAAVSGASGQSVGGLNFKDFEIADFTAIFFQAAVVQAIGGGLVGGVLTKGHPLAGFIHIAIMMLVAWASFGYLRFILEAPPPPVEETATALNMMRMMWG